MGRTLHEVFRIREVRDHRTGGTVVALNPPDTGSNRDPEIDVLRLVQPIPGGRDRSSGGWQAETAADLEQRSLTRSKRRSSIWPLRSRTCRRVSSPSTSRTRRGALCPKPPFIGS